jgi:Na+-translocating ferredoxin:NAD+ oxidoreductase RnfC subunit
MNALFLQNNQRMTENMGCSIHTLPQKSPMLAITMTVDSLDNQNIPPDESTALTESLPRNV